MRLPALFAAFFLLWAGWSAHAENFQTTNKISSIGPNRDYFTVFMLDPQTQDTEEIRIDVGEATLFEGVPSLGALKAGDVVNVEGDYNDFTKTWSATLIQPKDLAD